ncbi:MAG: hypothetical protein PHD88_04140 [Firmicutes bacterium]|nr:hypothetical protein [Bacillota bacterium]MDD4263959.1 hypothetical protein [Bacillota bacterium]MDD4693580.1 hypothetical protein [Bacillota bacterium]
MDSKYPYINLARRSLKDILKDDLIYLALSIIPILLWTLGVYLGILPHNMSAGWTIFLAALLFVLTYEFAESFNRPEELQGFGYGTYSRLIWVIYIKILYFIMQITFKMQLPVERILKRWGKNAKALAKRDTGKWMYPVDAYLKNEGLALTNELRVLEYQNMTQKTLKLNFSPEDHYRLRVLLRELWPEYEPEASSK